MKKNRTMKVAALLLALTLMTSCFVGGTFAKYTTTGDAAADEARVAKWGVAITAIEADANTLFTVGDGTLVTAANVVVAPGTEGEMSEFNITGTPEVKVSVTYAATVDLGENWLDDQGKYYCPLVVTVGETEYCGLVYEDVAAFESAIERAIVAAATTYNADQSLDDETVNVSWRWAIEAGTTHAGHNHQAGNEQTDERDTDLGDKSASSNAATISISISCTVDQVVS